jgi:hypothetical protein
MDYILFFVISAATGLTARLIPTMLEAENESSASFLEKKPLGVLLSTWGIVFVLLLALTA